MSKLKWIGLALLALIAILVIHDRIAYSNARSKALENCANDFDRQFGGNHQGNLEQCEALFAERGH